MRWDLSRRQSRCEEAHSCLPSQDVQPLHMERFLSLLTVRRTGLELGQATHNSKSQCLSRLWTEVRAAAFRLQYKCSWLGRELLIFNHKESSCFTEQAVCWLDVSVTGEHNSSQSAEHSLSSHPSSLGFLLCYLQDTGHSPPLRVIRWQWHFQAPQNGRLLGAGVCQT